MAYRPKTRVVAKTPDGLFELFAVLERPDGELQIFLKPDPNYEDPIAGDVPVISEKYSIHPGEVGGGTTIKRTMPLADGRVLTTSAYIEDSKENLLWPIYSQRVSKFFPEYHGAKIREKDKSVVIAEYVQSSANLIISLFVSSIDRQLKEFPDTLTTLFRIPFSRYTLGIYFNFIDLPSLPATDFAVFPTSPQQETIPPIKPEHGSRGSFTDPEAEDCLDYFSKGHCVMLYCRLEKLAQQSQGAIDLSKLQGRCFMVILKPFEELEDCKNKPPVVLTPVLPKCENKRDLIVLCKGVPFGKIFLP